MPAKELHTPYPVIDIDPHFKRVVGYMRPNDYLVWTGATGAFPLALSLWNRIDPAHGKTGAKSILRVGGWLGFTCGFLLAYQRSSFRFLGVTENEREAEMDLKELGARAKAGLPLYGETDLSEYLQGVASRNSTFSVFKLQTIPWFNFVNHNNHGVDTAKYYEYAKNL